MHSFQLTFHERKQMNTIYQDFENAALAQAIQDAMEIDASGFVTIPGADELFAQSLPEGLTIEQVNQSYEATANFNQAVASALGNSIACEIKDGTELGQTVNSFTYSGTMGNLNHSVAATVSDGQIAFTAEVVNPNDTTNALFASLTEAFAAYVATGE